MPEDGSSAPSFWAVALFAYRRYTEKPSVKRYLVVLIAFLFGLMSKATLVTFPFVLLLLDGWPLRRAEVDGEGKRQLPLQNGVAGKLVGVLSASGKYDRDLEDRGVGGRIACIVRGCVHVA